MTNRLGAAIAAFQHGTGGAGPGGRPRRQPGACRHLRGSAMPGLRRLPGRCWTRRSFPSTATGWNSFTAIFRWPSTPGRGARPLRRGSSPRRTPSSASNTGAIPWRPRARPPRTTSRTGWRNSRASTACKPEEALAALDNPHYAELVEKDYQEGVGRGVVHTPTALVNGTPFIETFTFEEISKGIDDALAQAK